MRRVLDRPSDADVQAVTRCLFETERAVTRLRHRFGPGTACSYSTCEVTHPSALVNVVRPVLCYEHRVGYATERNHAAGHGRGPVLELPANEHRVFSEIEALRCRFLSGAEDLEVAFGLVTFSAMRIAQLGRWVP